MYLARDAILEREVAVKFLPLKFQQDPLAGRRFQREARACAGLDHPFIAQIHEVGEEDGRSFLVMEYLRGETLRERLAEGPVPLEEALRFAAEIAGALHAAHTQNIIHRDLKPSNIMITHSGHVKVMDFGLAKVVNPQEGRQHDQNVTGLTGSGVRPGTVPYMSPEQLKGGELDTRSDIFSFGILLYEKVTGRHLFRKAETFETASSILKDPPPPLPPIKEEGGGDLLSHVLRKMLAKRPEDRYQSALDLRIDLDELRTRVDSGRLPSWRGKAGRWTIRLPLGLALLAVAAAGSWWLAFTRYEPQANRSTLVKVHLDGGEPLTLCECGARWGVAWSPQGYLLLGSPTAGLLRIPESGGQPEPAEPGSASRHPQLLPSVSGNGEVVFYTVPRDPDALAGEAEIWAWVPAAGEHRKLANGWDGRYVPTGHLVFGQRGKLKALPFHLGRLEARRPEVTLVEGITQSLFTANTTLRTGAVQMGFSATGLLAYVTGSVFPEIKGPLAWLGPDGREELLEVEPRNYHTVRISPDGTEVLLTAIYPPQDIWLFEPLRRSMRRQTFENQTRMRSEVRDRTSSRSSPVATGSVPCGRSQWMVSRSS